jgi:hypothetical protein
MTMSTPAPHASPSPEAFMTAAPKLPSGNTAFASMYAHELHEIINRQAHRQPRTLQTHLGPSEIGAECLSGETEVITRQGIRTIREVAKEGGAELLIPSLYKGSAIRKRWGTFREVPVEYFGEQELYEIVLRRNRDTKIVFATATHNWYRTYWSGRRKKQQKLPTTDLHPGYRLTQLRRAKSRDTTLMPVAIAQGFTFGDGTEGTDDDRHRPATLSLYHDGKDEALLPYFPGAHTVYPPGACAFAFSKIRGLPRFWKHLPPLDESTSFLMSWLAGYFAADGSVTEDGHCKIDSAYREHLEFVRSAAAICGIGYGQIQTIMRRGISGKQRQETATALYRLSLRRWDLPDWFFLIPEHARRVQAVSGQTEHDPHWLVESVTPTGRTEQVYCAITGEASAFALADDLMTGNCDRQVVGKLAGEPPTNHVVDPWASIVGTAVHAWLAEKFGFENNLNGLPFPRWLTEQRVSPHPSYPGTADLYDTAYKAVVDWKILGPTSMAKVRRPMGPPARYQIQLLLYALGYRNLGLPVERVMLAALPRTEPTLDAMYVWEHVCTAADDVLIEAVLDKTGTRRQIAGEVMARRIPITAVPITPSDDGCFFCPYYRPQSARDGGPGCPGHSLPR